LLENGTKVEELLLPNIEQKVAFLSRPEIYPELTRSVETKETHMSWVFLTDTRAWKLKKPVRYDFLDFSTLEARRIDCEEELRLNRRLAANVYYGVAPLTGDSQGEMRLAGAGETIDWLVKMRRLPAGLMLDHAIANRTASAADARKVGALLAGFYMRSLPVEMTGPEYRKRLTDEALANQRELENPDYSLPADSLESITKAQLRFLERERNYSTAARKKGKSSKPTETCALNTFALSASLWLLIASSSTGISESSTRPPNSLFWRSNASGSARHK
jgi:aminoglycoside phosphotransferase family enzyme